MALQLLPQKCLISLNKHKNLCRCLFGFKMMELLQNTAHYIFKCNFLWKSTVMDRFKFNWNFPLGSNWRYFGIGLGCGLEPNRRQATLPWLMVTKFSVTGLAYVYTDTERSPLLFRHRSWRLSCIQPSTYGELSTIFFLFKGYIELHSIYTIPPRHASKQRNC